MWFDGLCGNIILIDWYVMLGNGLMLMVIDCGFGNVLNGFEFNYMVIVVFGDCLVLVLFDGVGFVVCEFCVCVIGLSV